MKVAFAWGRANPPTIGHSQLFKKLDELAKAGCDSYIFVTQTENTPTDYRKAAKAKRAGASNNEIAKILRNPLPWTKKIEFLSRIYTEKFPDVTISTNASIKTIRDALRYLYIEGGYTEVVLVTGADHITEYEEIFQKFLAAEPDCPYTSTEVVSVGDRDPDSDTVEGMSATKLRQFVLDDNFEYFSEGVDTDNQTARLLFDEVKAGLTIPETYFAKLKESVQYLGTCVQLGQEDFPFDPTEFAYMEENGEEITAEEFANKVGNIPYSELKNLLDPDIVHGKYQGEYETVVWAYDPNKDIHYIWG